MVIDHLEIKATDSRRRLISTQNLVVNRSEAKLQSMTSKYLQQTLMVIFCLEKHGHMEGLYWHQVFFAQEILSPSVFGLSFSIKVLVQTLHGFSKEEVFFQVSSLENQSNVVRLPYHWTLVSRKDRFIFENMAGSRDAE